ncbi:MbtH family protein [Flexivirga sp. B27]
MTYVVVCNAEEQFALWPEHRPIPDGWTSTGFTGDEAACTEYVDREWTDLRPASLRAQL